MRRVRLLPRIIQTVAAVLCIVLAVLVVGLTAGARTGLYATYTLLSQSMEPAIPRGSVVVVVPVDPAQLRVGDVITFSSNQPPYATLTHRIVSVQRDGGTLAFQTKGDADLLVDPWKVTYVQQAGMVLLSVPLAGYALAGLSTGGVQIGLGAAFAALLAAFWLLAVWGQPPGSLTSRLPWPGRRRLSPVPVRPDAPGRVATGALVAAPAWGGLSLIRAGILLWLAFGLVSSGRLAR